jgi:DNA-binding transcriptional regulator YdaS (Cro superfamily)
MRLSEYIKRFSREEREQFAFACGTTVGHLNNVAGRHRTASAALTRSIARQTGGAVPEWELRPDDWHVIWPELQQDAAAPQGAPVDERRAA